MPSNTNIDILNPNSIGDAVYSEAGIVGVLLVVAVIWLAYQWKSEKKAHTSTIEKLYTLGTATVEQSTQTNSTLEKIYQLLITKKGR